MSNASLTKLKRRMDSIQNLSKVIHAMELIATSKLPSAHQRVKNSAHYFEEVYSSLLDIIESDAYQDNVFMSPREIKKSCLLVISGDRGFAGGYNSGILKEARELGVDKNVCYLPIGKKIYENLSKKNAEILSSDYKTLADIGISECKEIAQLLTQEYKAKKWDELIIVYTNFVSTLTQKPANFKVLPLKKRKRTYSSGTRVLYEPDTDYIFDYLVPQLVFGLVYGAICESFVSEIASRKSAMNTARQNADEILEKMEIQYSRLRQESITSEISEIIVAASIEESSL